MDFRTAAEMKEWKREDRQRHQRYDSSHSLIFLNSFYVSRRLTTCTPEICISWFLLSCAEIKFLFFSTSVLHFMLAKKERMTWWLIHSFSKLRNPYTLTCSISQHTLWALHIECNIDWLFTNTVTATGQRFPVRHNLHGFGLWKVTGGDVGPAI